MKLQTQIEQCLDWGCLCQSRQFSTFISSTTSTHLELTLKYIYIYVYKADWNCSKTQLRLSVAHKAEFWYCTWHEDLFLPLINMCCIILSIVRCLHWTCRKVLFKKFGSLKPSILQLSLKERIVKDSWKMAFWSVSAPASNSVCQDSGFRIHFCVFSQQDWWMGLFGLFDKPISVIQLNSD